MVDAAEVVLGLAVQGTAVTVSNVIQTVRNYESILNDLRTRLQDMIPRLKAINRSRYSKEIEKLIKQLKQAKEIVDRCSEVSWWNYYKKYKFAQELMELDDSLRKMLEYSLPLLILEDTRRILDSVRELHQMVSFFNRIVGSIRSDLQSSIEFVVNQIQSNVSWTAKLVQSQPDIIKDIVLWRRKKLSRRLLFMSITTWLLLQVYQFKFITVASWLAMVIVVSLFLWGDVHRFLGHVFYLSEETSMSRFEISEETAMEIANFLQTLTEETIRWMVHVSIEREWFVFARTVAALLLFSYMGTFIDLLTLLCVGSMIATTIFPVIYMKHRDNIKTCELVDEKLINSEEQGFKERNEKNGRGRKGKERREEKTD